MLKLREYESRFIFIAGNDPELCKKKFAEVDDRRVKLLDSMAGNSAGGIC